MKNAFKELEAFQIFWYGKSQRKKRKYKRRSKKK